jgi:hypothetical protein
VTISTLPSPSPLFLATNSTKATQLTPTVRVNLTSSAVTIIPKGTVKRPNTDRGFDLTPSDHAVHGRNDKRTDSSGNDQGSASVSLSLANLRTQSQGGNTSAITLLDGTLLIPSFPAAKALSLMAMSAGEWNEAANNSLGASQSFIFTSQLASSSSA